jgi:hypothetical protein
MPVSAQSFAAVDGGKGHAAQTVFPMGDGFEMRRIHAPGIPAQVVNV